MSYHPERDEKPSQREFRSLEFADDVGPLTAAAASMTVSDHGTDFSAGTASAPESRRHRRLSASSAQWSPMQTPDKLHLSEESVASGQFQVNSPVRSRDAFSGTVSPSHFSDNDRSAAPSRDDLCNFYDEAPCSSGGCEDEDASSAIEHPLDISWLSDRCDGDVHLLVAVLETFCEQGKSHCSAMDRALAEDDMQKLCFHTDFIVGSARNVGARQLEQRAENLATGLRACLEHGTCVPKTQNLEQQVSDVTMCFFEVSTFWQIGVQSVQGGSVHPLEQMDTSPDARGYAWPKALPSNFKLSMVQLQDYLKSMKDETQSDKTSARSLDDEEDEATEPNQGSKHAASPSRPAADAGGVAARTSAGVAEREPVEETERVEELDMNAVFQSVRVKLERMRRSNGLGHVQAVREEAQAIVHIASNCGSRGIAGKAEGIANSSAQYVLSGVLDELELQVDSAEAIWKSSGWII